MSLEWHNSSGNLTADRRYDYAMAYMQAGEYCAALDLLEQTADIVPNWPVLHFRMGEIYSHMGNPEKAMACFREYLRLDEADTLGAIIKLSLLGAVADIETLPSHYVETLFDQYAPRFDKALVETLDYRAPQLIFEMMQTLICLSLENPQRILDLGCGTGLMGEVVFPYAAWLDGVDLSAGMIAQAETKNVYNNLTAMDGTAYMAEKDSQSYDVVLAADVLVYIGDLSGVFEQVIRVLQQGGLFVFTCQKWNGEGFVLGTDHRFSHSRDYLSGMIKQYGWECLHCCEQSSRNDGGKPVEGFVVALRRPNDVMDVTEVNPAFSRKAFSHRQ